ncbi:MAG: hypothetical protein ACKOW8_03185, partial [Flavobacteriales bacterium]
MKLLHIFFSCAILCNYGSAQLWITPYSPKAHIFFEEEEDEEKEDERKGFSFGLNLGAYFSSSETANIYNGDGGMPPVNPASNLNWYSIEDRIGVNSLFINDIQAINTFYNSSGYAFLQDSYPYNMR